MEVPYPSQVAVHDRDQQPSSRARGRPRRADAPIVPWPEVDRLLVFGEKVKDEAPGRHAGVPGFLHDTEQLYEAADAEGQEWRDLVHAWWEKFGPRWVSAGELLDLALERDLLGSIVRDKAQRAQKIRLGKALSSARDRHFDHFRIVAGRNASAKTAQYRLVDVDGADTHAPGEQMTLATPESC